MTYINHKTSFLIRLAILAGSVAFAWTLPAQTSVWLSLEVGNTWLYRPSPVTSGRPGGGDYRAIWVRAKETIAGREYFDVSYFGREVALRVEPSDGSVLLYDRTSGTEQSWLALGLSVGGTFPTQINPCPTSGQIAARDASVTTPAGQFNNAVQVTFAGNCVDVGVTRQFYAAYVGLIRDEETTIAGPLVYELVYYRVGSRTVAAQEVSFTMALDAAHYDAGATLSARLTLRSSSPDPILLNFPSGQSFDFVIRNDNGDTVYSWSAARTFAQIVRNETFGPGEETYGLSAPLDGLPAGHYTAQGYLTTNPAMYLAQGSFDITPTQGASDASARIRPQGVIK